MRISTTRVSLFGLFGTLALAGCGQGDAGAAVAADAVPEADRYGGTAVVASMADLQTMNSLVSSDYTSGMIQREILFMPLVKYDENLDPQPWLAERWDTVHVAPDSLELTFHLRRDVNWHDGVPTTANDVLFTFERAIDPRTAFPNASNFALWNPEAELIDDYTIRFRLRAHADFLDMWYQTPAMPAHILGDVPPGELLTHRFGTAEPVGNGPFRFARRVVGQEWVFEANPDFPEALGGRPYLDRFIYRNIPEQTTLLTEILTGRIDMYLQPNPAQKDRIEATAGVELRQAPFRQWTYLAFNTRLPMFQDARVRRALTMAIDRQGIVDALLYGTGDIGRGTVTPAHWAYDPNDPETLIPYDPDGARRLLAEAGWTPGADGMLRDAQGNPFRFTLITNQGNDLRADMMQIIQAQLRQVGVQVQPRTIEWNTMVRQLHGSVNRDGVRERDFEATIAAWVDYFRKDDTGVLHSKNLNNPFQYVGYANPRVDNYIDTLLLEMDRERARPIWASYQRFLAQEAPYTVLHYPRRLTAVRTRLHGVDIDARGEFISAAQWWIAPGERRGGTAVQAGSRDTAAQAN